jgi:hypothetical protein
MTRARRITSIVASFVLVLAAFAPAVAFAEGHDEDTNHGTETLTWTGQGADSVEEECLEATDPYLHWVLTPGGPYTLSDATLTVGGNTYTGATRSGGEQGALHFDTAYYEGAEEGTLDASVTFSWERNAGQADGPRAQLVISDGCAAPDEPAPDEPVVGAISVTKAVAGELAEDAPFAFRIACEGEDDVDFDLGAGETRTFGDLKAGTDCTLTELVARGADRVEVSVDGSDPVESGSTTVTIGEDTTIAVTFTNVFEDQVVEPDTGGFALVKTVTGDVDDAFAPTFDFSIVCDDGTEVSETLGHGDNRPWDGFDVGTECTITETDDGGAADTIVTVDGDETTQRDEDGNVFASFLVAADTSLAIEFTNHFEDDEVAPVVLLTLEKDWQDQLAEEEQIATEVVFVIDGEEREPGQVLEVEPGQTVMIESEIVTGLPEGCETELVEASRTHTATAFEDWTEQEQAAGERFESFVAVNDVTCVDDVDEEAFVLLELQKNWEGDLTEEEQIATDVTFVIDGEPVDIDANLQVEPGATIEVEEEIVDNLPDGCEYVVDESSLTHTTTPWEEWTEDEQADGIRYETMIVTNVVSCDDEVVDDDDVDEGVIVDDVEDDTEVRGVVLERDAEPTLVARAALPRTGASLLAMAVAGLLALGLGATLVARRPARVRAPR